MTDKVFCDSNILIYAFDKKEYQKSIVSKEILRNNLKLNISVQVINEVSNIMLKKLKFTDNDIRNFVEHCYRRFDVVNLDKDVLLLSSRLRESVNISYYDSLIVSTALNSNCTTLYSEDMQHEQMIFDRLKIINPFKKEQSS